MTSTAPRLRLRRGDLVVWSYPGSRRQDLARVTRVHRDGWVSLADADGGPRTLVLQSYVLRVCEVDVPAERDGTTLCCDCCDLPCEVHDGGAEDALSGQLVDCLLSDCCGTTTTPRRLPPCS